MDNSINLNSGFGQMSFKGAELILISREQRLRAEVLEMEEKYSILSKENEALKKKCDWLRDDSKKDTRLMRVLRDDLRAKESEVIRARTKIRYMEKREEDAIQEIKSLEEEKAEAQREIEKHLQKISCLEKEKENAHSAANKLSDVLNSFKGRIDSLGTTTQARFNTAYDGDVENRFITKIKEESDMRSSSCPLNLSGQNLDPSLNGLKRKRDSSGSSSSRVLDTSNDNNSLLAASESSWQTEADMSSAIGTNPIVAMEAVCALYRQHKSHVNRSPVSAFLENRGFDRLHVLRGRDLAEYLLNGDPKGEMRKSPEELQLHDPKGLDDCKRIATTNSKQLFEIYQRQDDPFFGPK